MRIQVALSLLAALCATDVTFARSSGRPSSSAPRRSSGGRSRPSPSGGGSSSRSSSKRRSSAPEPIDEYDEEEDPLDFGMEEDEEDDDDGYDDYDEEEYAPRRGSGGRGGQRPPQRGPAPTRGSSGRPRYDEYDEDEYDEDYPPRRGSSSGRGSGSSRGRGPPPGNSRGRGPPPRGNRGGRNDGRMVSYNQGRGNRRGGPPPPSTFTRGLSAIRDKMPDPTAVKDTMLSATKAAQEKTSQLSSNIYREVKGLTSSELEQVMLKSTRPDGEPVKSKHVERLVGVTYQISGKYDIYDAVLRKLWNKMSEKDIRTKLKSVYVLHRFAVDGGPDHQEALKQRLRALRKTKDPKRSSGGRGGTRYFDSKVLIGQDNDVSL